MTDFEIFSIWYMVITSSLLIISIGWNIWWTVTTRAVPSHPALKGPAPVVVARESVSVPITTGNPAASQITSDPKQIYFQLKEVVESTFEKENFSFENVDRFVRLTESATMFLHQPGADKLDQIAQRMVLIAVLRNSEPKENLPFAKKFFIKWWAEERNAYARVRSELKELFREFFRSEP